MSGVAFQVRIDEETHRRWRVKAAELGYPSLSHLVRAAVELHGVLTTVASSSDTTVQLTPMRESVSTVGASSSGRPCAKSALHKKGTRCGYCRATPTKDGE